jgi:hypothetical protein
MHKSGDDGGSGNGGGGDGVTGIKVGVEVEGASAITSF